MKQEKLKKIKQYTSLCKVVLAKHKEHVFTDKLFGMVARLIKINPDFYSLWNYRRDMVNKKIKESPKELKQICAGEMTLSEMGLRKNPKSYYAWHHRIWIIAKGTTDLKHEVKQKSLFS